jgi:hypothetical protein
MNPEKGITSFQVNVYFANSAFIERRNDQIIKIINNINGKEKMNDTVCTALSPPVRSKAIATPLHRVPQQTLTEFFGSRLPLELMELMTKVAESAEVIKNMQIISMVTKERSEVIGRYSYSLNIAEGASARAAAAMPGLSPMVNSRFIAVPPRMLNQMAQRRVGARSAPKTNSLMVRPLEIRAIKAPTKGAQTSHQAQ